MYFWSDIAVLAGTWFWLDIAVLAVFASLLHKRGSVVYRFRVKVLHVQRNTCKSIKEIHVTESTCQHFWSGSGLGLNLSCLGLPLLYLPLMPLSCLWAMSDNFCLGPLVYLVYWPDWTDQKYFTIFGGIIKTVWRYVRMQFDIKVTNLFINQKYTCKLQAESNYTSKTDIVPWCYKWYWVWDGWIMDVPPNGVKYRTAYGIQASSF